MAKYLLKKAIPFFNLEIGKEVEIDLNTLSITIDNNVLPFTIVKGKINAFFVLNENLFKIQEIICKNETNEFFKIINIDVVNNCYIAINLNDKEREVKISFDDKKLYTKVKIYYFISVREKISIHMAIIGKNKEKDALRKRMNNFFKTKEEAYNFINGK